MKVKYVKTGEYQGTEMTLEKVYLVLAIEYDSFRLLDDSNEPYLYSSSQFEVVDPPDFWVSEVDEDGDECFGPPSWHTEHFFEKFHDGVQHIKDLFWRDVEQLYGITKS